MFKSCCARPNKRNNKNKTKSDNMDSLNSVNPEECIEKSEKDLCAQEKSEIIQEINTIECSSNTPKEYAVETPKIDEMEYTENLPDSTVKDTEHDPSCSDKAALVEEDEDSVDDVFSKPDVIKKRFSVDYKNTARLDFKRFSVDCSRNVTTLEELSNLERELARTNVDVRPIRRKSSGILKSTTSSSEFVDHRYTPKDDSDCDDDVFERDVSLSTDMEGPREPPATPVGRDELALRRHRFFSDLVCAARAAVEHRVRFDPLGPVVADSGIEASEAENPAADLEALIERLERVTSRLERLPCFSDPLPSPKSQVASPVCLVTPPQVLIPTDNMSINGYQDILQGPLRTYLELSKKIGGDVATHAKLVNEAFQAQYGYIQLAASRSKPSQAEEMQLLSPTSEKISAIQQFREKNRVSTYFNHLSAISESIPALGWVAISPTPAPYVKEMNDAGQFYTNRVLKDWKEKDKTHIEWCRTWVQLLSDLQAYVKQYHTTGLVWSGKGGAPPPPPPGGLPPPPMPEVDFSNLAIDDRSALFAEINRGEGITSNLRKVTSEMQTHKNPQLREGPAPFKAAPRGAPAKPLPTPGAGALPDKPPVFARDGKKWLIEYQKGNSNLVVENADMNNMVYMFRCRDSALTVRGKVNGVILDSCTKCAVVFDNLVSSIEFVNCQSVQMQVLGKVPTISIDKTDGCQIYLSKDSLDVEIVSSKSSEMNVLVPQANGDFTEHPIPEQYKTVLNKPSGLTTTPVENKG
ncbi:adenylyl cyclase-associated protein 1 isoform X1 [Pieris napi]|uniref:adenylyl cyclase-associated protein 1 isoform X1 n=2 Tax=Pieris napi TaxID=78633 RepID=UPI001FBAC7A0|nr:adenylyl cyclase-associated protein 1 isoform X1 [Pieris napi]